MKANEAAIVLTGYQNEFCAENGILHGLVKDMLKTNNVIPNSIELIKGAVQKRVAIFNTPIVFSEGYPELSNPVGIFKNIKDAGAFLKNKEGSKIIGEFSPFKDYIIEVKGKTGLSCFGHTNLDDMLGGRGIKTIACAGLLTNVCVESTARAGYDKGYEIIVLKDCTACKSLVWQEYAEENIFPMLGKVMGYKEFLANIE